MIIADTSPLIVLGRLDRVDILGELFGSVTIPTSVYQEAVIGSKFQSQREAVSKAVDENILIVTEPMVEVESRRRLDAGEKGVLRLDVEKQAEAIIMDDKKARNEAQEMGFTLFYTTDILKGAEQRGLIDSYTDIVAKLTEMKIYLPE